MIDRMLTLPLPIPKLSRLPTPPIDAALPDQKAASSFGKVLDDVVSKVSVEDALEQKATAEKFPTEAAPKKLVAEAAIMPVDTPVEAEIVVERVVLAPSSPVEPKAEKPAPVPSLWNPAIAYKEGGIRQPEGSIRQPAGPIPQPGAPVPTPQLLANGDKIEPAKINLQPVAAVYSAPPLPTNLAIAHPATAVDAMVRPQPQPLPIASPIGRSDTAAPAGPTLVADAASNVPRTVRITLRPQELGEVQVVVRNDGGQLRVTIVAETEAAHAALTARSETLAALTRDIRTALPTDVTGIAAQAEPGTANHTASAQRQDGAARNNERQERSDTPDRSNLEHEAKPDDQPSAATYI
ncbi:MAG: flagellar hook-length control protein FliK [Pseudomonadota bacterium]